MTMTDASVADETITQVQDEMLEATFDIERVRRRLCKALRTITDDSTAKGTLAFDLAGTIDCCMAELAETVGHLRKGSMQQTPDR